MTKDKIVFDKFSAPLEVGDLVVYAKRNELVLAVISKFTPKQVAVKALQKGFRNRKTIKRSSYYDENGRWQLPEYNDLGYTSLIYANQCVKIDPKIATLYLLGN